jgi:hypothetical protein
MKRFTVACATIAIAAAALPGTAFAAVDTVYGTDPVLDQKCDELLQANDNSGFTTYAVDIHDISSSSVSEDVGPPTITGIGTPTSVFSNFHGAHVNGQSVNIFAYGDYVVTYAAGALATYQTKITTTTTRQGTCHVHKPTPGADNDPLHPGFGVAPPGQQITTPVTATTVTETYGTRTETIPGPWVDPNASSTGGEVVICNSPGRNPGTWRGQNGYTNQIDGRTCSTTWYNELGSTPSVSVPAS